MIDAAGNATHIGYDARGQKVSSDDPDLGEWHYAYSVFGALSTANFLDGDFVCGDQVR